MAVVHDLVVGFIAGFGWGGLFGLLTGAFIVLGLGMRDDEPPTGGKGAT